MEYDQQIGNRDIVGMLRIKNEARWIVEVLDSYFPLCRRIFVFDDHSTDRTVELLISTYAHWLTPPNDRLVIVRSPFSTVDESRDKNLLYQTVLNHNEYRAHPELGFRWPSWICHPDGDEILDQRDVPLLLSTFRNPNIMAARARILYLWNDRDHIRVDGVYRTFNRPTFFRVFNPSFKFQSTPWGKDPTTGETINFHCSSIPQELLYLAVTTEARILHLGYMLKEDRIRKYEWYNKMDPGNHTEDCYRHVVQGDVPEIPAEARLRWAGPLEIQHI